MYRVITYRSKLLKKNTIPIDFDELATDSSVADFAEEKQPKRKKSKNKPDEKTYFIDGVEVREEDLTADEKLDLEANALLNGDGFYTPLLPLDYYDEENQTEGKKTNVLMVAAVVLVTVALLAGIVVGMMIFMK